MSEYRAIAVEHTAGALVGFRQVMGPRWVRRHMEPIHRLLQTNDAVILEKTAGTVSATLRYTLTDEEPDLD